MNNLEVFSARDPEESRVLTVNFTDRLDVGETIVSAVWEVMTDGGTVVTGMTQGTIDVSEQPLVKQLVKGGNHNTTYLHRAKATTSTGRVVVGGGLQSVYRGA